MPESMSDRRENTKEIGKTKRVGKIGETREKGKTGVGEIGETEETTESVISSVTSVLILPDAQAVTMVAERFFTSSRQITKFCGIPGVIGKINEQLLFIVSIENIDPEFLNSNEFRELFTSEHLERITYVATCISAPDYVEVGDIILATSAYMDPTSSEHTNLQLNDPKTTQGAGAGINANYNPGQKIAGIVYAPSSSLEPLQAAISAVDPNTRVHVGTIISSAELYDTLRTKNGEINDEKPSAGFTVSGGRVNATTPNTTPNQIAKTPTKAADTPVELEDTLKLEALPPGAVGIDSNSAEIFSLAATNNKQALSVLVVSESMLDAQASLLASERQDRSKRQDRLKAALSLAIAAASC